MIDHKYRKEWETMTEFKTRNKIKCLYLHRVIHYFSFQIVV
jgi:hypothetical protein